MPPHAVELWLGIAGGEVSLAAGRGDDAAIALLRHPGAAVPPEPSGTEAVRAVLKHFSVHHDQKRPTAGTSTMQTSGRRRRKNSR